MSETSNVTDIKNAPRKMTIGGFSRWLILGVMNGMTIKGRTDARVTREAKEAMVGDWDEEELQNTPEGLPKKLAGPGEISYDKTQAQTLKDKLGPILDKGVPLRTGEALLELLDDVDAYLNAK